jgi:probable HAF family extracellular repeat protein
MKSETCARIIASAAFVVLCLPPIAGQVSKANYRVLDLGTLGGSLSIAFGLNDRGVVEGFSTPSGNASFHAFVWRDGIMTDLGTLGGPNSESFFGPNERGQAAGVSELSTPDPNGEDFCGFGTNLVCLPFLWRSGLMQPLPLLGGNNGQANDVNNRGEAAGWAETADADPTCPAPQVLQFKPAVWLHGKVYKLPTFSGDEDGIAYTVNDEGQAVGGSGSCATFDSDYGAPLQPLHALLWEGGRVINLGSLGGTLNNIAFTINNARQVAGTSGLAGNLANHAFLWQDGVITDLGTLPGDVDSGALGVSGGQVVGASFDGSGKSRAFLWQKGVMRDLNDLVSGGPPLFLLQASAINSQGQIAGFALRTDTGEVHAFLAVPNESDEEITPRPGSSIRPNVLVRDQVRRLLHGRLHLGRLGAVTGDPQ